MLQIEFSLDPFGCPRYSLTDLSRRVDLIFDGFELRGKKLYTNEGRSRLFLPWKSEDVLSSAPISLAARCVGVSQTLKRKEKVCWRLGFDSEFP